MEELLWNIFEEKKFRFLFVIYSNKVEAKEGKKSLIDEDKEKIVRRRVERKEKLSSHL